jgi:GNAT superfamily N-acetyltransferase
MQRKMKMMSKSKESLDLLINTLHEKYNSLELHMWLKGQNDEFLHVRMIKFGEADRGKGYGTMVMSAICEFADIFGLIVSLSPIQDKGVRYKNRLIKFYKRFGFKMNKGRNKDFRTMDLMIRLPKDK